MRHSLNEFEVTTRKAAIGAGFPVGIAVEMGQAAAWLAASGLDGSRAAVAALGGGLGSVNLEGADFPTITGPGVGMSGPSAFDLLLTNGNSVTLANVDTPLLLVGMAGVTSRGPAAGVGISFDGGDELKVGSCGVVGDIPATADIAVLKLLTDDPCPDGTLSADGSEIAADDWACLCELASRTYVPESEESREQGAGAGSIDND